MKRIFAVLLLVALTACDHVRPVAPPTPPGSISSQSVQSPSEVPVAGSPRALIGDQAVADLRRWYDDTRSDCGGATSPAFVCSGVMLRATANSANYLPWNPNPNSTGVSFSWIRKDTNFSKLAYGYGNGFIFYPKSENAAGSQVIDVECAFPHDGGTNDRPSLSGCGPTTQYPQSSRPCDDQGIQTYSSWLQSFNGLVNKHQGQCGWSMRSSARANRFTQFILARQGMAVANWSTQNELRMVKWAQNSIVPVRAFFYLPGIAGALGYAQEDQRRYKIAFNTFVPIIRLTLASSKSDAASFAYVGGDQVVPDPGDGGSGPGPDPGHGDIIDFENIPLQGPIDFTRGKIRIPLTTGWIEFDDAGSGAPTYVASAATPTPFISGHHLMTITRPGQYDLIRFIVYRGAFQSLEVSYTIEGGKQAYMMAEIGNEDEIKWLKGSGTLVFDAKKTADFARVSFEGNVNEAPVTIRIDNVKVKE